MATRGSPAVSKGDLMELSTAVQNLSTTFGKQVDKLQETATALASKSGELVASKQLFLRIKELKRDPTTQSKRIQPVGALIF